jgi:hypothetical protein
MARHANADAARLVISALLVLGPATGCQHADYSQRRLDQRNATLIWTVQQLEKSEASRPDKLDWTFTQIKDVLNDDAQKLDRNVHWIGRIIQSDARRFEDRQPDYRRVILDILDGKPEAIEMNAIDLFY